MQEFEIEFETSNEYEIDLSNKIQEIKPPLDDLEVIPTKEQQVFKNQNQYGYDVITVEPIPDEYIIPDGTLEVAENGDIDVTTFKTARVGVYIPPTLQDKSITITSNGTQNITYDEGYDGLNSVEIMTDVKADALNFTNITELSNEVKKLYNTFMESTKNDLCDVYTNEPVTLYSPASGYNNYVIRYRSSGGYCIVWYPDSVSSVIYGDASNYYSGYPQTNSYSLRNPNVLGAQISTASVIAYMYTSNSTSLSKCIEALKSPTTQYTTSTSGSTWGYTADSSGYMIPMTNMSCFKDGVLQPRRMISNNETIVIKQ